MTKVNQEATLLSLLEDLEKPKAVLAEDIIFDRDPNFSYWVKQLRLTKEFCFDIETFGINKKEDASEPETGEIRLLQVYLPEHEKVLIWDLGGMYDRRITKNDKQQYNLHEIEGLETLRNKLECPETVVDIQNAAFEGKWIVYKFGVIIFNIWDSMIASQLIWAGTFFQMQQVFPKPNSLASIAARVGLGTLDKENQFFDYALELGIDQFNYAATDVRILSEIKTKLIEEIEKIDRDHINFYQNLYRRGHKFSRYEQLISTVELKNKIRAEMLSIPAFIQMRYYGFPVSVPLLEQMKNEYQKEYSKLQIEIEIEMKCSATSSTQLLKAFHKRDIHPTAYDKKTNSQKPSTSEQALETLDYPIAKKILLFRAIGNRLDRIIKILERVRVHPVTGLTVVHSAYSQNAAKATGRTSSSEGSKENPIGTNLQNIPKHPKEIKALGLKGIREAFQVPTNPDNFPIKDKVTGKYDCSPLLRCDDSERVLLILDFAGSHAQLAGYISNAKRFFEARETGIKLHFYTASKIFALQGKDYSPAFLKEVKNDKNHSLYDEVDAVYDTAKKGFFSSLNGSGPATFQAGLKADGIEKSLEECKLFLDAIDEEFPEIAKLKKHTFQDVTNRRSKVFEYPEGTLGKQFKYFGIARTIDGGIYYLQKLPSKYSNYDKTWKVMYSEAIAINWLNPEGTIIKAAMGLLSKKLYFDHPEWDARIINICHDELEVDVLKKHALECSYLLHETVNKIFKYLCKSYVEEDVAEDSILYSWNQK